MLKLYLFFVGNGIVVVIIVVGVASSGIIDAAVAVAGVFFAQAGFASVPAANILL